MVGRIASIALALALLATVTLTPHPVRAAEVQVAFDAAGRIQRVDATLARRLGLFWEQHPGFHEARLFMATDSSFVLEISTMRGIVLTQERELLTRAQADALRADIQRRLGSATEPEVGLNQEGRSRLVAGTSLLGLSFYGWAVPVVADAQDPSVAIGAYMLTAGGSFFLPLLLTQNSPVSWSMANLSMYGATRGITHGLLLERIVRTPNVPREDSRAALAMAMGASIGEGVLGYAIARQGRMTGGTAETIGSGGDYGMLWGYVLSDFAGFPDREADRTTAALMLTTSFVSMGGAAVLAKHRAYSRGDAVVMRSSGYVGVLLGTAFADLADPATTRPYSVGLLAGSAAGLLVGDRLVEGREFTPGEGVLIQMGGSAGALMGLGAALIAQPEGAHGSSVYWFGAAIGGALGYTLTYRQLSHKAAARSADGMSWGFDLAPEALLWATVRRPKSASRPTPYRAPVLLRLHARF